MYRNYKMCSASIYILYTRNNILIKISCDKYEDIFMGVSMYT